MSKPQKYWNIKKVSGDNRSVDVFIYGIIGQSFWDPEEANTAKDFVTEFKALESQYDRINIHINSPGGDIWEGLPIFNVINQSERNVHTYVDGIAYSMAAIILLAGKEVHASKNSLLLMHSPLTIAIGNAKDMRTTADELDKYEKSLITSVTKKTGKSEQEIKALYFDYADHLLNAQEAKDQGLIDDIIDEEAVVPEGINNMTYRQVMTYYMNSDDKESFMAEIINRVKSVFNVTHKNKDIIMENLEKFQKLLNLEGSASVDDVISAITALNQKMTDLESSIETAKASLVEKSDALVAAQSKLANEVEAHANTKKAFEDFKALDAGDPAGAVKEKDKIEGSQTPEDLLAHNQVADNFLGK